MKTYDCDLDKKTALPRQARPQVPAPGTIYGCVDWFQYDPPALAAADRATDKPDAPPRDMIAALHEQRRLMGYVR
ncbi:MAG: hypothetical protein ACREU2_02175 [Steroidobacteraceae bacterium]